MLRDGTTPVPGRLDRPHWEPLVDLVGTELAGWFMWMCQIDVDDHSSIHAYKHAATRRYLHLHEDDGRAFMYVGRDRYREIHPRAAIDEALADWERLLLTTDDPEAIRAGLRHAYERADGRASAAAGER
jgi:hypothetical protein